MSVWLGYCRWSPGTYRVGTKSNTELWHLWHRDTVHRRVPRENESRGISLALKLEDETLPVASMLAPKLGGSRTAQEIRWCQGYISRQSSNSSERLVGWGQLMMPFSAMWEELSGGDFLCGSSLEDGEIRGGEGQAGKQISSPLQKLEKVESNIVCRLLV